METKENICMRKACAEIGEPVGERLPYHREFVQCLCSHDSDTGAFQGKAAYLRLITALFGYDITKGLTNSMSGGKIINTIVERFDDSENDKVALVSIGSVLQICTTLATPQLGTSGSGKFDFLKFCDYIKRLYGCDLSEYDPNEIHDFRYHVMAYLKGRTQKERDAEKNTKKNEN